MNKHLTAFFTEKGMHVTGNSAYGMLEGFEANVNYVALDNVSPVKIHFSFYANDEQKRKMEDALRNAKLKFFQFSFTAYGLVIGLNDITVKRLANRLQQILDTVCGIIKDNGGLGCGYCPVCGKELSEESIQKCNVDGVTINMDENCKNNINEVISAENKDFAEAPNNYLKGFCGALIGGLAGALVAVLFYIAGFISALSAIVSIVLGAFLYQKFHGKRNNMMIVIVSLTTVVCMVLSIVVTYIVSAGIAAADAGLNMSAIEAFVYVMQNEEVSRAFYLDLGLVLLFTAIGVVVEILELKNKIKRRGNIK